MDLKIMVKKLVLVVLLCQPLAATESIIRTSKFFDPEKHIEKKTYTKDKKTVDLFFYGNQKGPCFARETEKDFSLLQKKDIFKRIEKTIATIKKQKNVTIFSFSSGKENIGSFYAAPTKTSVFLELRAKQKEILELTFNEKYKLTQKKISTPNNGGAFAHAILKELEEGQWLDDIKNKNVELRKKLRREWLEAVASLRIACNLNLIGYNTGEQKQIGILEWPGFGTSSFFITKTPTNMALYKNSLTSTSLLSLMYNLEDKKTKKIIPVNVYSCILPGSKTSFAKAIYKKVLFEKTKTIQKEELFIEEKKEVKKEPEESSWSDFFSRISSTVSDLTSYLTTTPQQNLLENITETDYSFFPHSLPNKNLNIIQEVLIFHNEQIKDEPFVDATIIARAFDNEQKLADIVCKITPDKTSKVDDLTFNCSLRDENQKTAHTFQTKQAGPLSKNYWDSLFWKNLLLLDQLCQHTNIQAIDDKIANNKMKDFLQQTDLHEKTLLQFACYLVGRKIINFILEKQTKNLVYKTKSVITGTLDKNFVLLPWKQIKLKSFEDGSQEKTATCQATKTNPLTLSTLAAFTHPCINLFFPKNQTVERAAKIITFDTKKSVDGWHFYFLDQKMVHIVYPYFKDTQGVEGQICFSYINKGLIIQWAPLTATKKNDVNTVLCQGWTKDGKTSRAPITSATKFIFTDIAQALITRIEKDEDGNDIKYQLKKVEIAKKIKPKTEVKTEEPKVEPPTIKKPEEKKIEQPPQKKPAEPIKPKTVPFYAREEQEPILYKDAQQLLGKTLSAYNNYQGSFSSGSSSFALEKSKPFDSALNNISSMSPRSFAQNYSSTPSGWNMDMPGNQGSFSHSYDSNDNSHSFSYSSFDESSRPFKYSVKIRVMDDLKTFKVCNVISETITPLASKPQIKKGQTLPPPPVRRKIREDVIENWGIVSTSKVLEPKKDDPTQEEVVEEKQQVFVPTEEKKFVPSKRPPFFLKFMFWVQSMLSKVLDVLRLRRAAKIKVD